MFEKFIDLIELMALRTSGFIFGLLPKKKVEIQVAFPSPFSARAHVELEKKFGHQLHQIPGFQGFGVSHYKGEGPKILVFLNPKIKTAETESRIQEVMLGQIPDGVELKFTTIVPVNEVSVPKRTNRQEIPYSWERIDGELQRLVGAHKDSIPSFFDCVLAWRGPQLSIVLQVVDLEQSRAAKNALLAALGDFPERKGLSVRVEPQIIVDHFLGRERTAA